MTTTDNLQALLAFYRLIPQSTYIYRLAHTVRSSLKFRASGLGYFQGRREVIICLLFIKDNFCPEKKVLLFN